MNRIIAFAVATLLAFISTANAGQIFITGHDPIWHSNFGGNAAGARNLASTGIEFARNGSTLPFLFVESKTDPVPSGNARTAPFLTSALGYTAGTDFVHLDAAELGALADFRTELNSYSAIVVASDHGGMLTTAELSFLNNHASDVIDYLNAGGGLFAEAESNAKGLIGATPRFGFLPFVVSSTDFQAAEVGNTVTPFGASLGLVNADVNGNFSHNFFSPVPGMMAVDLFNGDPNRPLTLAFSGTVDEEGPTGIPMPVAAWIAAPLFGVAAASRPRRRRGESPRD